MPQGPPHTKGCSSPLSGQPRGLKLWISLCSKMGRSMSHSDKTVHKKYKIHIKQHIEIVKTDHETVGMILINVEKDLRE
ncbi:hypothetical protein CK910_04055 [Aeromonas sp. CA23]|nr:hypothetical protein CK910_04055 [Aeromonas sp. CA23]